MDELTKAHRLSDPQVWEQIQDACNCSTEKAKNLARQVMRLVQEKAYSVDRAIEQVLLLADAKAMGLTEPQIAQAQREGVTTILGLRRIEKNSRKEGLP